MKKNLSTLIIIFICCSCSKEVSIERKLASGGYELIKFIVNDNDSTANVSPSQIYYDFGTQFGHGKLTFIVEDSNSTLAEDWYYLSSPNGKDYNQVIFHDIDSYRGLQWIYV